MHLCSLQSDRQYDQNLNNDTFYRMPVTSPQVVIGTEKYPQNSILLIYNDDEYSQRYGQIKEVSKALSKGNVHQPYIGQVGVRSSNDGDNIGNYIHAFDIRCQKKIWKWSIG